MQCVSCSVRPPFRMCGRIAQSHPDTIYSVREIVRGSKRVIDDTYQTHRNNRFYSNHGQRYLTH